MNLVIETLLGTALLVGAFALLLWLYREHPINRRPR